MDMGKLQHRIDEYNKETKELVDEIQDTIQKINKRAKEEQYWKQYEYEDLENFLSELDTHHQVVQAFLDGCQIVNDGIEFQLTPLLDSITPIMIEDYAQYISFNYNLKYSTLITSVINIIC